MGPRFSWDQENVHWFVEKKALDVGEEWALSYFRGSYKTWPGWNEVSGRLKVTGFYFDNDRDWATLEITVQGARHLDYAKLCYPREEGPLQEWTPFGKEVEGADVALAHQPWLTELAQELGQRIWLTQLIPHNGESWREAGLPGQPGYSLSMVGRHVDSALLPFAPGSCLLAGGSEPFLAGLDLQTRRPYGGELTVVQPDGRAAVVGQDLASRPGLDR